MAHLTKPSFNLMVGFLWAAFLFVIYGDYDYAGASLLLSIPFFVLWFVRWTTKGRELWARRSMPSSRLATTGSYTAQITRKSTFWKDIVTSISKLIPETKRRELMHLLKTKALPFLKKHWQGIWVSLSAILFMVAMICHWAVSTQAILLLSTALSVFVWSGHWKKSPFLFKLFVTLILFWVSARYLEIESLYSIAGIGLQTAIVGAVIGTILLGRKLIR